MDESGGDEDTGTEVLAEEEDLRWNLHPLDLLCYDRKAAATNRGKEHNDFAVVSNSDGYALGVHSQTAATCRGKSYSAPSASLPQTGFSISAMMNNIK
jgi:hypothetical protein